MRNSDTLHPLLSSLWSLFVHLSELKSIFILFFTGLMDTKASKSHVHSSYRWQQVICLFFFLITKDLHILSTGLQTYTSDERFQVSSFHFYHYVVTKSCTWWHTKHALHMSLCVIFQNEQFFLVRYFPSNVRF